MPRTRCLPADQLTIGMQHETELHFTHDDVAQYCALMGDYNAIHRKVEAARQRFPEAQDVVVPGGLIQSRISALFGTTFPGDGSLGLTFAPERFRRPVYPGDTLTVQLEVAQLLRGGIVEMAIQVSDAEGSRITTASARLVAPDSAYHAWWQAHIADV